MIRIRVRLSDKHNIGGKVRSKENNISKTMTFSENATFTEFEEEVGVVYEKKLDISKYEILIGFPPTPIAVDDKAKLLSSFINNNETVIIQQKDMPELTQASPNKSKTTKTTKTSTTAASASKSSGVSFGARMASLHQPKQERKSSTRRTKFNAKSEEDVAEKLLNAVSKTGSISTTDKFLRKALRRTMELEYDSAKAKARVNSLLSGKYQISVENSGHVLEESSADGVVTQQLFVQYHKGIGSRSFYSDKVDKLSAVQLKAVLTLLLSTEQVDEQQDFHKGMLKPHELSRYSPRIFWSIVHMFGADLQAGFRSLMPSRDWSFLSENVRKRELSEKCKENLEVEEEMKRRKGGKRTKKSEDAVEVEQTGEVADDDNCSYALYSLEFIGECVLDDVPSLWKDALMTLFHRVEAPKSDTLTFFIEMLCNCTLDHTFLAMLKQACVGENQKTFLSLRYLEYWQAKLRVQVVSYMFNMLCSNVMVGGELASVLYEKLKVKCFRDLCAWRLCPADYLDLIVKATSASEVNEVSVEDVERLCNSAHEFRQNNLEWVDEYEMQESCKFFSKSEIESEVHPDEELKKLTSDEDDLWRVLSLKDQLNGGICCEQEGLGIRVRLQEDEEGMVVGYLAATSEEPMALWKVLCETGEYIDLEEDELKESVENFRN